jgi:hypothetical protein
MKDIYYSKKQAILIRRIDIGGISRTIRPSFIMPYMTGVMGEIVLPSTLIRSIFPD